MYKIEASRGGKKWQKEEILVSPHTDLNDLSVWVKAAKGMDSYGGKYEYRVVDETGKEFYHSKEPYEGIRVDICESDPSDWLNKIRYDYGISIALWKQACEAWLKWWKDNEVS